MNKVFASAAIAAGVLVSSAFADVITMNDGQVVENAVVSKVGIHAIEYTVNKRKVHYTVKKSDVAKITYKNGSVDTFPLKERRKGRYGDEFRKPSWGKGPAGMGPGGERRGFRGRPGEFGDRDEFGPPPPDGPYYGTCNDDGPKARLRDGRPVGQPGERYRERDYEVPPPLPPPPTQQGAVIVPQPPKSPVIAAPPPPAPPKAPATVAPPPPPPTKAEPAVGGENGPKR